jgi:MFS transporter, MHS family, proline/betaine transporter
MGLFSVLNREQKQAIGLLQIGTFLEYFDLMLYVHMAVLLNELFFPKSDPHTESLMTALAFCTTYAMRPIGALIFGWIGDNVGRKSTIIFTTTMMAISCIIMANLPTYAQIGITATWVVTLCRIFQGMSSLGEIVGAQIYVTESISRPMCYPAVAFVSVSSTLGAMAALGVATLVTSFFLNWRFAFWIGAIIAIVGSVARSNLRETPDFLEMKRQRMKKDIEELNQAEELEGNSKKEFQQKKPTWKQYVDYKTLLSYFMIYCGWPLSFYLAFVYFNPILKENFGYSSDNIIQHNFFLSMIMVFSSIFWSFLSYRIHPLKIIKVRGIFVLLLMILMPVSINFVSSPIQLFIIQASILLLPLDSMPAQAVFVYHFPIYRRFTYASFLYALSRTLTYFITSFGLVYLIDYFGSFGLWLITLPVTVAYLYGVLHFEGLERRLGFYPNLA